MKKIYAEVMEESGNQGNWRGGVVVEENGFASCPGWDTYHDTREEAMESALEMAEDYTAECISQEIEAEFCGVSGDIEQTETPNEPPQDSVVMIITGQRIDLSNPIDGVDIHAAFDGKQWTCNDGYNTTVVDTLEEAIEEVKDAVGYYGTTEELSTVDQIVTPAEIERQHKLSPGTVRQYLTRHAETLSSRNLVRKADQRTWLIDAEFARQQWGKSNG
jgi:hypothetical protein